MAPGNTPKNFILKLRYYQIPNTGSSGIIIKKNFHGNLNTPNVEELILNFILSKILKSLNGLFS